MKKNETLSNGLGAFADAAVLLPILALLTTKVGYSGSVLFLSSGILYCFSAWFFRIPMSVQPLKSIAVAALTVGATFSEVRVAGLLLGVLCLMICFSGVEKWANKVPKPMIHQIQLGLGVLLVFQGIKAFGGMMAFASPPGIAVIGASVAMLLVPSFLGIPVLGLMAMIGLGVGIATAKGVSWVPSSEMETFRPMLVLQLVVPQMVLTLANSVLATRDVALRYFKEKAECVTVRRLIQSIGIGNIIMAAVGGLPFCHGSGGVTAHARGGARSPFSTAFFGMILLALALTYFLRGDGTIIIPQFFVASLLMVTGVFHMQLAIPTLSTAWGRGKLMIALALALATQNLLWILAASIAIEWIQARKGKINDSVSIRVE